MTKFSVKECVSFGWNTFKSRPWIFVGAGAVMFGVQFLVNVLVGLLEYIGEAGTALEGIMGLVILALSILVWGLTAAGTLHFVIRAHDDVKNVKLEDLWAPQYFWTYVFASIVSGIIVILGLILLIVPGVILGLALFCTLYLVVDKNMGVRESIKRSMELTKGSRWKIFLLSVTLVGLNILGFCALLIGLIITIPVSHLAYTHAYRKLASAKTEEAVA